MPAITSIQDLKKLHERRVPRMFYDYAESGSWTEQTFRDNTTDFRQIRLRQRARMASSPGVSRFPRPVSFTHCLRRDCLAASSNRHTLFMPFRIRGVGLASMCASISCRLAFLTACRSGHACQASSH